ncbi:MAG TPA: creatininase family protein, partial [Candidatus Eisenbacteria bacterium]|nr:creatininase family protein [Candidatus Eisenbacteria bacterium]
WAELTWEELRDLDRSRIVALLPVGAIEAHGPHLPLATDVIIAEAMAEAASGALEDAGRIPLLLPAISYTAAPFGGRFPGTLSVGGPSVTALIVDLARELTRQGIGALAIANAHLDPAHLEALESARAGAKGLLPIVCPDLTKKPLAVRLTEEFQSGACHAGSYEGSVVLARRSDLVRDEIRTGLTPNPASLSRAIREGARTFEDAGGPRAYFGFPADASAEEGKRTIATLGEILAEAVLGAAPAAKPGERAS